jgi:hypothetical protein
VSYMLGNVHVYVQPGQPMTRFVDRHGLRPIWFRCKPHRQCWTDCCRKRRWAKYVRVQVYYSHIVRFCADGHGCKVDAIRWKREPVK